MCLMVNIALIKFTVVISVSDSFTHIPVELWVPHTTDDCQMRRRADQLEILMLVVEREARISQAISHTIQRLLILNPLAVIHGPYP